jgi:hypothetical protein
MNTEVFYQWSEPGAADNYRTGISLHSHTNHSRESLGFLMKVFETLPLLHLAIKNRIARCHNNTGVQVDLDLAYWVPPLTPRMAFDLEAGQISRLGLEPLVSISDHDNIEAPALLQAIDCPSPVPISVEWSALYGKVMFHIGVHNLPTAYAQTIMADLADYTAAPHPARLAELLKFLSSLPDVLLVLNHPLWDLELNGPQLHRSTLLEFLKEHGQSIHALELNGLRNWEENRAVRELASGWNLPIISGGDRHGCEPNATINLTRARTFAEFVHEVRRDCHSHVLMMQQYAEPMQLRVLQTVLDVVRNYPNHPVGSCGWDDRVFHPQPDGSFAPVASMWVNGQPKFFERIFTLLRMVEQGPMRSALRFVLHDGDQIKMALDPAME